VFKEIGNDGVEWIQVAQDMIKWWHSNDPLDIRKFWMVIF